MRSFQRSQRAPQLGNDSSVAAQLLLQGLHVALRVLVHHRLDMFQMHDQS